MFTHTLNPTIFEIGPIEIRWYGLMYVVAFFLAYYIILRTQKDFKLNLSEDDVGNLLVYLAVGMIIGARLIEVIFYNPTYYLQYPLRSLMVWRGGLSFHGGLIGMITAGYLFSRKHKIPFLKLADLITIPASLGLMFGRIGNFINGELVGRVTNVPWCFKFRNYEGCRHPSQLYEAFKNLIIFSTLYQFRGKKDGFILFLFMIMYAILRSIIEFYRMPDAYILGLTQGQFLNIFVLIAGLIGMWWIHKS